MAELNYSSTPPVEYGDPQALVKLRVDAILAAADVVTRPALAGLTVSTKLPTGAAPAGPLVTVRSGPWTDYTSAAATNVVRVVAWHRTEDAAWDVATYLHAHLRALRGDAEFRGFGLEEQPNKGTDPDYGWPIVAFAVRARMKPRVLPV